MKREYTFRFLTKPYVHDRDIVVDNYIPIFL